MLDANVFAREVDPSAPALATDLVLHGMDAIYVAMARRHGCSLVTLDDEPRDGLKCSSVESLQ
jgi:predicted nucleic acid-binding protein